MGQPVAGPTGEAADVAGLLRVRGEDADQDGRGLVSSASPVAAQHL